MGDNEDTSSAKHCLTIELSDEDSTTSTLPKASKRQKTNKKSAAPKQKDKVKAKSGSKKKKAKDVVSDDSEDVETPESLPPAKVLTAYIHVLKPQTGRSAGYVSRDPFSFTTSDSYETLISKIAAQLPCPVGNVPASQIQWCPKTPAKSKFEFLGGEIGYKILLDMFRNRRSNASYVLTFNMPPPAKEVQAPVSTLSLFDLPILMLSQFWDTGIDEPRFNHDAFDFEVNAKGAGSVAAQKVCFSVHISSFIPLTSSSSYRFMLEMHPLSCNLRENIKLGTVRFFLPYVYSLTRRGFDGILMICV
jgi:hypothetical protein